MASDHLFGGRGGGFSGTALGRRPKYRATNKGRRPENWQLNSAFSRGALQGLPSGSWSLCSVSALLWPAALVPGLALGLPLWALSWCLSVVPGPVLVSVFLACFAGDDPRTPIVSSSFVEAIVL